MVITSTEKSEALNYIMERYEKAIKAIKEIKEIKAIKAIKAIKENLRLMNNVDTEKNSEKRRSMLRKSNILGNFVLDTVSTKLRYLQHDISERADTIKQMKNAIYWMKLKRNTKKVLITTSTLGNYTRKQ